MNEEARAARYSDLFEESHRNVSDCAYCPICTAIAAVRSTQPELLEHLARAAREMVLAAGLLLQEAGDRIAREPSATETSTPHTGATVTRIDIG